jgi:uncharacterized RDD family membrane protein YckC
MTPPAAGAVPLGTDDVLTGEAVALDLPPATVAVRLVSSFLDLVTDAVVGVATLLIGLTVIAGGDAAQFATVAVLAWVLGFVVTPTAQESLLHGKTLGKLALGLRTVRDDSGPISFRHALVRALVGVVEGPLLSFVPAFISELVNGRGKRLGDFVAGTYVVRDRFRLLLPPPVPMPPELEQWARRADVVALPDGLALAVRQFLARTHRLNPQSRVALGSQLCGQVLRYAAPSPPPHAHPEAVLAAVLATRRERDAARLHRDGELRDRLGVQPGVSPGRVPVRAAGQESGGRATTPPGDS